MMRFILFLLFAWPGPAFGQLRETFSDGDFSHDPEWVGTEGDFIVNTAGVLQLQATAAGTSFLSTPVVVHDSSRWTLDVRMPFAPSASNKVRLYLMTDRLDLGSGSGYFVEIGENGSADALRFYRQDAGVSVLLASGVPGALAQQVDATIKARRNAHGHWWFEMRQGSGAFDPQFEVSEGTYGSGQGYYFGVQCTYTASRSSHFFFDNIAVEADVPDTIPPVVLHPPGLYDVLINECMADPSPSVGLPDVEWIELYNRSVHPINLASMTIRDAGGAKQRLPEQLLGPGNFVVLTTTQGVRALEPFVGSALVGMALPTLNNSGDVLWLERHSDGLLIDRVDYADYWHTESGKKEGGWSLERINPELPCLGGVNWASCIRPPGGTPGTHNSTVVFWTDTEPPRLADAYPMDAQRLRLLFSEGMDPERVSDPSMYQIEPDLAIGDVEVGAPGEVLLWLAAPLVAGELYRLRIGDALTDCSGNSLNNQRVVFGLPEQPLPGDIRISELMFNPPTGGSRYVELYNLGNRVVDMSRLFLHAPGSSVVVQPVTNQRLLAPGTFMVLSGHAHDILTRYRNIDLDRVLETGFPALDSKTGSLSVYWADKGQVVGLDSLAYRDDWHTGFLSSSQRKGTALERIRLEGPSNDPANWTSASARVTGAPGTPTLPNSQTSAAGAVPADWAWLVNSRLSPDADGFEDYLEIRYQLPGPGYVARVGIYSADGQVMRQLVPRALAGTEGVWRWDGDTASGAVARPGIYMVYAEAVHPEGDVRAYRQAFALVRRW